MSDDKDPKPYLCGGERADRDVLRTKGGQEMEATA
jgi:hypothetical protein